MIGAELERRPCERPPLSKDYLRGEAEREKGFVHEADFYERQQIELITGRRATAIDPHAKHSQLGDGASLDYDKLLLITGADFPYITVDPAHDVSISGVANLPTNRSLTVYGAIQIHRATRSRMERSPRSRSIS